MGGDSEEEDQFFDTRDEIASTCESDCGENYDAESVKLMSDTPMSEFCSGRLSSVHERRINFVKWMGTNWDFYKSEDLVYELDVKFGSDLDKTEEILDRVTENSGAVLANSDLDERFSSNHYSRSIWSNEEPDLDFGLRIKNLDDGTEFVVEESTQNGVLQKLREIGSNRWVSIEEFHKTIGYSPFVQQYMRKGYTIENDFTKIVKPAKKRWFKKPGPLSCVVNIEEKRNEVIYKNPNSHMIAKFCQIQVRALKKRLKEFSSVYLGQKIQAHKGSILDMKFSPDGKYLASAGEDRIVRVWQVTGHTRIDKGDIPVLEPSRVFFTANHSSQLIPLSASKDGIAEYKSLNKMSEPTYVVFPPEIFGISETPLHEFHGHTDNVLNLSWTNNQCLLSCSEDKTVRLWQVGCNTCLKVFPHNNYVTCIQVNPCDSNYFISGSIDGKVRIWAIPTGRVVDWTNIADIVTAVCYNPDGKGGIIGCMSGNCHYFSSSGNTLQLGHEICLQGKKKYPNNKITGFQFCPNDSSKLVVTSADSQVRLLRGNEVICKYKGIRNTGTQISASFTSDGKHIISASEDSNVYIWNCNDQDKNRSNKLKSIESCERFLSINPSVAISWPRIDSTSIISQILSTQKQFLSSCNNPLPHPPSECLPLGQGFFSIALSRGTPTWPEEKLPFSSPIPSPSTMTKARYKFLKIFCQNAIATHSWGEVIVTASYDGQIRSYLNYGLPMGL